MHSVQTKLLLLILSSIFVLTAALGTFFIKNLTDRETQRIDGTLNYDCHHQGNRINHILLRTEHISKYTAQLMEHSDLSGGNGEVPVDIPTDMPYVVAIYATSAAEETDPAGWTTPQCGVVTFHGACPPGKGRIGKDGLYRRADRRAQ